MKNEIIYTRKINLGDPQGGQICMEMENYGNIDPRLNLHRKYKPIFVFAWKIIDHEKNLHGNIPMQFVFSHRI